jgi:hypothetical protein
MATKTKHARPVPAIPALDAPSALPRQSGTPSNGDSLAEEVRRRAYAKWEAAGMPPGDGVNFWLDAEQELRNGG